MSALQPEVVIRALAKFYYRGRDVFAKTRADYQPRMKLNLAFEEYFRAASLAPHNPAIRIIVLRSDSPEPLVRVDSGCET